MQIRVKEEVFKILIGNSDPILKDIGSVVSNKTKKTITAHTFAYKFTLLYFSLTTLLLRFLIATTITSAIFGRVVLSCILCSVDTHLSMETPIKKS